MKAARYVIGIAPDFMGKKSLSHDEAKIAFDAGKITSEQYALVMNSRGNATRAAIEEYFT